MAVPDELIQEVGSLLGYNVDPVTWLFPTSAQVRQWLIEGQRDLAARLVPDALAEMVSLQSVNPAAITAQVAPGTRILAVLVGNREARHIPLAQSGLAVGSGLFAASASSPAWALSSAGGVVVWPSGLSHDIYYIPGDFNLASGDGDIVVGRHLYPLLVSYATSKAKQADEDDVGAQAFRAEYEKALGDVNATHAGRHGILVAQAQKDGTGR